MTVRLRDSETLAAGVAGRLDGLRRTAVGKRDESAAPDEGMYQLQAWRDGMGTIYNHSLCLKVSSSQGWVVDWTAAVRMRGAPLVRSSSADSPTCRSHDHALGLQIDARRIAHPRSMDVRDELVFGLGMGGAVTAAQCARHGPLGAAAQ